MSAPGLFRSRALAALIVLAVVAAGGIVFFAAFGSTVFGPSSIGPSAYSRSALGYRGALAFLTASGIPASQARDWRLPHVGPGTALVITEPSLAEDDEEAWDALFGLVADGRERGATVVLVLPKWEGLPQEGQTGWIGGARRRPLDDVQDVVRAALDLDAKTYPVRQVAGDVDGVAKTSSGTVHRVTLRAPQFLPDEKGWEPLLSIRQGMLVGAYRPEDEGPPIVVVADPDLLNNHGLDDAEHAAAMLELFRDGLHARSVVFDETLHGFEDTGRLLRDAFRPPAVLVTAHLALALALAVWAGTGRLGPPRPVRPAARLGREAFIDSTVRLLAGARDEVSSLGAYWKLAQEVVAEELRLPPLPPSERLRRLTAATAARRVSESPSSLDAEISTAIQFETDPKRWVALAQRAHRWRKEMTGGL